MNLDHECHIARLSRRMMTTRYMRKRVYKYPRCELTIPVENKDLAEEFMNKDLKVEAKKEGNSLAIEAKPTEYRS